jgi:catechol 2,3-dioxygenase-like lactoylglutathione lyase family enzyme
MVTADPGDRPITVGHRIVVAASPARLALMLDERAHRGYRGDRGPAAYGVRGVASSRAGTYASARPDGPPAALPGDDAAQWWCVAARPINHSTRFTHLGTIKVVNLRIQCPCIDSADPARAASFWESALGWRRTFENDDEVCLEPPEGTPEDGIAPDLVFLKVPQNKVVKNRLHLDLRPADLPAEVARLEGLGARRVDIGQGDVSWVVMTDPEGNAFDVLQPLAPDELPPGYDALGRRITDGASR